MSRKFPSPVVAGRTRSAGRSSQRRGFADLLLVGVVVLVAALGIGTLTAAFAASPSRPPQPPAAASPAAPEPGGLSRTRPGRTGSPAAAPAQTRSEPISVTISKIHVAADVVPIGTDGDGRLEVPPLEQAYLAGWYRLGPSPGEIGNAVIVGHVDSYKTGPAVFFNLGELRPGDTVAVTRKDRTVAQFTVDQVQSYPKMAFPVDLVYGRGGRAALRLVTCGGKFDAKAGSYLDNIVVFATLAFWRRSDVRVRFS